MEGYTAFDAMAWNVAAKLVNRLISKSSDKM